MKPAKTVRLRVSFETNQPDGADFEEAARYWKHDLQWADNVKVERLRVERVEKKRGKRR